MSSNVSVKSQNIEAERALLCTMLLIAPSTDAEKDLFVKYKERLEREVFNIISENDFFDKRNAELFRAVRQVVERDIVPDILTVGEAIDRNLKQYLLSIADFIPAPINLREYARIIKKHSFQRQADEISAKKRVLRHELESASDEEKRRIRAEIDALLSQEIEIYRQIQELEESTVIKKFTGQDIHKPVLRCNGLLPEGYVSMLAGSAGTGKTYIALTLTVLYILETKRPALVWLSEDLSETEYRINQMLQKVPLWKEYRDIIMSNLYYVDEIPDPLLIKEYGELGVNIRMFEKLKRYISDFGFTLLDPLTDFFGQEENNNTAARMFMNTLKKFVYKTDKILLVTHHTNKINVNISESDIENNDQKIIAELRKKVRGASAFIDAPRTTLYLIDTIIAKSENDLQGRYLVTIKSNLKEQGVVQDEYKKPAVWEMPFTLKNEIEVKV